MRIGFIGLGQMGKPIAMNLRKAGSELIVTSRNERTRTDFRAVGATVEVDPKRICAADIIFLCLPDADVSKELLFGENDLASQLKPGQTVVDLSTTSPQEAIEHAQRLAKLGVSFLDAPVSGMQARAVDGTLTIMCGGPVDTFEAMRPWLENIGRDVLHMGPAGSGQAAKLVNQLLFDINIAAFAEILPMAMLLGLDPEKVAHIVNMGTGRSYASEFFLPRILQGLFSEGYPMHAAYKDLKHGISMAVEKGIPVPVLAAATSTYQLALLRGFGTQNKGAMIRVFEDLLKVEFRNSPHTAGLVSGKQDLADKDLADEDLETGR